MTADLLIFDLDGTLADSERDLAATFKVSRPTIREAMIALEIQGLAEARHGSGIYVTDRSSSSVTSADHFLPCAA